MVLKDARKGNPLKYNDKLKEYFKFEIFREDGELYAVIYDFNSIEAIKPLGNLGNLGNLEKFTDKEDSLEEKNIPHEKFQISQNSQISNASKSNVKLLECPYCGLKFGSRKDLEEHIRYWHGRGEDDV